MRALYLAAILAVALQASGALAGTSPGPRLGSRRVERPRPAATPECPPGQHAARSGPRPGCAGDAPATCPAGYARYRAMDSAGLRCMSLRLRATGARCAAGEEPAVDARGLQRCALPEDPSRRPGDAPQAVPDPGARCSR